MTDAAQNAVTEALWSKVQEDFTSGKAHEAFLNHCRDADCLTEAARRYREYKNTLNESQEDERKAVDKRLAAVAIVAMSQIDMHRSEPDGKAKRVLSLIAAMVTLVIIISLAALAL